MTEVPEESSDYIEFHSEVPQPEPVQSPTLVERIEPSKESQQPGVAETSKNVFTESARSTAAVTETSSRRTIKYTGYQKTSLKRPDQRGKVERCCMCCVLCYREEGCCTFINACRIAALFLLFYGILRILVVLIAFARPQNGFAYFVEPMLFFLDSEDKIKRYSFIVVPAAAFMYDLIPALLIALATWKHSETSCILYTSVMILGTTVTLLTAVCSALFIIAHGVLCKPLSKNPGCTDLKKGQLINATVFCWIFTVLRFHFLKCGLGLSYEIRVGKFDEYFEAVEEFRRNRRKSRSGSVWSSRMRMNTSPPPPDYKSAMQSGKQQAAEETHRKSGESDKNKFHERVKKKIKASVEVQAERVAGVAANLKSEVAEKMPNLFDKDDPDHHKRHRKRKRTSSDPQEKERADGGREQHGKHDKRNKV